MAPRIYSGLVSHGEEKRQAGLAVRHVAASGLIHLRAAIEALIFLPASPPGKREPARLCGGPVRLATSCSRYVHQGTDDFFLARCVLHADAREDKVLDFVHPASADVVRNRGSGALRRGDFMLQMHAIIGWMRCMKQFLEGFNAPIKPMISGKSRRPEVIVAGEIPDRTASETGPLRFGQIGLVRLQGVLGDLRSSTQIPTEYHLTNVSPLVTQWRASHGIHPIGAIGRRVRTSTDSVSPFACGNAHAFIKSLDIVRMIVDGRYSVLCPSLSSLRMAGVNSATVD